MQASKSRNFKIIMSIMIPLLVIVTTAVMVGASFAWFTNAEKVTITEITMSTADAYTITFDLGNNSLWDNMLYVGQTAFCDKGPNKGKLMTAAVAGSNDVDTSNRAYYFINTVALNTGGRTFDMSMAFDTTEILKYEYQKDSDGNYVRDENGNPIIVKDENGNPRYSSIKKYGFENSNPASDIPYAFTWFFKKRDIVAVQKSTNYEKVSSGSDTTKTYERLKQLEPSAGEEWYTPYGKLTFGEVSETVDNTTTKSVVVTKINDNPISVDSFSLKDEDKKCNVTGFSTTTDSEIYDFYIVFAPETMFWMQFFKADRDQRTASDVYTQDEQKKIFEKLENQMFYSSMSYSGSTFKFSAVIKVNSVQEEAQGNE